MTFPHSHATKFIATLDLLTTSMLCSAASAQTANTATTVEAMAAELRAMRTRIDTLEGEVMRLRAEKAEPQQVIATTSPIPIPGKSAPPTVAGSKATIEPFGQIQYDVGFTRNPADRIDTTNLGFNGTARRLNIGVRGSIPGDFKYNLEFNLTRELVDYEDVTLSWEPKGKPYSIKIGNHYPFSSLENMTSSRATTFVERASANEAFTLNRRIGASFGLVNKAGDLMFNAGIFNGFINNSATNTEYSLAARAVWSPKAYGGQFHIAGTYQYRRTPAQDQSVLYRARPYNQTTNIRFVGTGPATTNGTFSPGIATSGDQVFGVELAGIFGPFHFASEAHYVAVDAITPAEALTGRNATTGTRLDSNPEFAAIYGEVGYWLTGETRAYRGGRFNRTPIKNPVTQGGFGGLQLAARVDYLDLESAVGGTGRGVVNGVLNGGRQLGYLFAVNYFPTEFLRFTGQYSRLNITGGPNAGQVVPVSTVSLLDRSYNVDALVFRAQIEF
jgi:phosphate-selective porin OprO and OprP